MVENLIMQVRRGLETPASYLHYKKKGASSEREVFVSRAVRASAAARINDEYIDDFGRKEH